MAKFKVELVKDDCIGCGACAAVASELWDMGDDGKSFIKGANGDSVEVGDDKFSGHKEAAEACPVNVIHITNLDNKEKVI